MQTSVGFQMLLAAAKPGYRARSCNLSIQSPRTVWKRKKNGIIPFLEAFIKTRGVGTEKLYILFS